METLFLGVSLFLVLMLIGGLVRIVRGPAQQDRMLAAQLFGTSAVAILLLLSEISGIEGVLDVALVLALLAVVSVIAFVQGFWRRNTSP